MAEDNEREGYVPNVVYSCGALVHAGRLILPYAMSDTATAIVSVELDEMLACLRESAHPAIDPALESNRGWGILPQSVPGASRPPEVQTRRPFKGRDAPATLEAAASKLI